MAFDAALELLETIMRKPDGLPWHEHRRERHVKRERRVIAAAESSAHMSEMSFDALGPQRGCRLAEQVTECFAHFKRRLHTQHKLQRLSLGIEPGEPALGL